MPVTEVKVTFESVTALPEDRFVNVFHFDGVGAGLAELGFFQDFYNTPAGGSSVSVGGFMSPEISRAPAVHQIDFYDLSGATPRLPYAGSFFSLDAPINAAGLPAEVSACVSWKAGAITGVNPQRLRGRNYIGPLNLDAATTTEPVRLDLSFQTSLANAAIQLVNDLDPAFPLGVYSRAGGAPVIRPIVAGYVDNAFDTIRKRGPETTSRITF